MEPSPGARAAEVIKLVRELSVTRVEHVNQEQKEASEARDLEESEEEDEENENILSISGNRQRNDKRRHRKIFYSVVSDEIMFSSGSLNMKQDFNSPLLFISSRHSLRGLSAADVCNVHVHILSYLICSVSRRGDAIA